MNARSKALALLDWIQRDLGRAVRVVDILARYEIDRRTWRRWMADLAEAGFVWVDRGRGDDRTVAVYRSRRPSGGRIIVADPKRPPPLVVIEDDEQHGGDT